MANIINFNKDDQNNQQSSGQVQTGGQSSTITPVSSFNAQQSVPQESMPQKASSGQFTNIQKYLQANKGAGQQIAGNVSKQMDKSLQAGRTAQEDASKAFQSSVQQANDVLTRGQGYQQQLQAPVQQTQGILGTAAAPTQQKTGFFGDISEGPVMNAQQAQAAAAQKQGVQPVQSQAFNPMAFINDANRLTDFTKIKTGQGINEDQLGSQASKSQLLAGMTQTQSQGLLDRTKNAQGRTSLIGETFNRPTYTQGQQRLDSLFLTGAGKQGINALQDKAKQNVSQATNVYNQATQGVQQAGDLKTQEANLQKALQDRANALEQSYISQLQNQIGNVNTARDAERARGADFFNTLVGKQPGKTLDQDLFNELQLREGENTFKVLNDPNLTKEQIFNFSQRNAQNVQDVATQQDVDYYKALAQLSKGSLGQQGEFVAPTQDQLQLSKASDLDRAMSAITGDASLRNKLNTAQADFLKYALGTNAVGYGEDKGTSGLFGGGATAQAQAQMNLANFLNQQGGPGLASVLNPSQDYSTLLAGVTNPLQAITGELAVPGIISGIGSNINSATGASSGSSQAAKQRAEMNLVNDIYSKLLNQGYGNYLTSSGNKNIDQQLRGLQAQDVDRAEIQNRSEYNILGQQFNQDEATSRIIGDIASERRAYDAYKSGVLDKFAGMDSYTLQNHPEYGQFLDASRGKEIADQASGNFYGRQQQAQNEYTRKMAETDARRGDIVSQIQQALGLSNWNMPGVTNKYKV